MVSANPEILTRGFLIVDGEKRARDYQNQLASPGLRYLVLRDSRSVLPLWRIWEYAQTRIFEDMDPEEDWLEISESELRAGRKLPESLPGAIVLDGENNIMGLIPGQARLKPAETFYEQELKMFLSHELGNILDGVGLIQKLLGKGEMGTTDTQSMLNSLSNTILEFDSAYLRDGEGLIQKQVLSDGHNSFGRIVAEVISLKRVMARKKGLEIVFEENGFRPTGEISQPILLKQVLLNLVGNSIRYCPGPGKIRIRAELISPGDFFQIIVSDNGPGIPGEYQSKIFNLGFRCESGPEGGSGRGLYYVRRIVEKMGGQIQLNSPPRLTPGEKSGTEFVVRIPVRQADLRS